MTPSVRVLCFAALIASSGATENREARTVTLFAVDSFGQIGAGCRVVRFAPNETAVDPGPEELPSRTTADYADHFVGLSGRNIPFGSYAADVKCSTPRGAGGGFFPLVDRAQAFFIVANFSYDGDDYFLFPRPLLRVAVSDSRAEISSTIWIKLVGVFLNDTETAAIDPTTREAAFSHVRLGRYFLNVFRSATLICTKEIDMFERGATITLDLGGSCKIAKGWGIRAVNNSAAK